MLFIDIIYFNVANLYARDLSLVHDHIFELPRVGIIECFRIELICFVHQGVPVCVYACHRLQVGPLDLQAPFVVHFVGLNEAFIWIFNSPDHPSDEGRSDLKGSRILAPHKLLSVFVTELRAVPVSILPMPID